MVKSNNPRERSSTWLPFLRNHVDVSWAIDFFTVPTVSFSILYVFVVFDHGRRKVIHLATTHQPSSTDSADEGRFLVVCHLYWWASGSVVPSGHRYWGWSRLTPTPAKNRDATNLNP